MRQEFPVAEAPRELTIFDWILRETGLCPDEIKPRRDYGPLISFPVPALNHRRLAEDVAAVISRFGCSNWQNSDGGHAPYKGISLTWNPQSQDGAAEHASTLGTPRNRQHEFFYNSNDRFPWLLHSYFDTLGFRHRTQAGTYGVLGDLIDSFAVPAVRSRIGILSAEHAPVDEKKANWHRDEPVFICLRVNIPIETSPAYCFELQDEGDYFLQPGSAYTFDSNRPHRIRPRSQADRDRVHLVLGFSPWLEYRQQDDVFVLNRYYGELHPFDMLAEGLIHSRISL